MAYIRHRTVDTVHGPAQLHIHQASRPWSALVLGHGAGRGTDTPDLAALAKRLPGQGVNVVLVDQPWVVAGKRVAPGPKILDEVWVAVNDATRFRCPVVMGGRSAGARVACRTARSLGAVGVLALAFPLHPPGKPDRSRLSELAGCGLPALVVQGQRDPFGRPDEFPITAARSRALVEIPDANHSFDVPKRAELSQTETIDLIVESVLEWLTRFAS